MRALGLMSGTSLDGIDVALLTTDGVSAGQRGPSATYPYPPEFRALLRQALADATALTARDHRPGCLAQAEHLLTLRHATAVAEFLKANGISAASIDLIGFHGQTVLHRPADRLTLQLGLGPLLAKLTGIDVVFDLRAADVAAGGQGAPLVPAYHRALAGALPQRPVAFLNVGGVANLTWIGHDGGLTAFDTGPGNAPIDDFVRGRTGAAFDAGGALTAAGTPDADFVQQFLTHAYFTERPPKSLDRNAFGYDLSANIPYADGAATLAACAAGAVARAREWLPSRPELWVICGGGRHNRGLMLALAHALDGAVAPAEAVGLNGDTLEAEAWAYLAVRSVNGLPVTFPATTGAPRPLTGGVLATAK